MPLPGDDVLPAPDLMAARAITINAPSSRVWPWVAQLGQNRGGFYTYDWLENLVGSEIHSSNVIVPALRIRAVGDMSERMLRGIRERAERPTPAEN